MSDVFLKAPLRRSLLMGMSMLAFSLGAEELGKDQGLPIASPSEILARSYLNRHEYREALAALRSADAKSDSLDAKWIAAESLFRLKNFAESQPIFEEIFAKTQGLEQQKAAIRLFDMAVLSKDLVSALRRYVDFQKQHAPQARMNYSLGKLLYDRGYLERASKVLQKIPTADEFYMRARYIMAAVTMADQGLEAALPDFSSIEHMPIVSGEDYAVHDRAILAQARIYVALEREELAQKTYYRLALMGGHARDATVELASAMLRKAKMARLAKPRFQKLTSAQRQGIEKNAIAAAHEALARYQKIHDIDWQEPRLLTVMGALLIESKRYEDARLLFAKLSDELRPAYQSLLEQTAKNEIWSYFALNKSRGARPLAKDRSPALLKNFLANTEAMQLKARIEDSEAKLSGLEERMKWSGKSDEALLKARQMQDEIINSYHQMVLAEQKNMGETIAALIDTSLSHADFLRAELVDREMRDLFLQRDVVRSFQNEKTEAFDAKLKELDDGGSL